MLVVCGGVLATFIGVFVKAISNFTQTVTRLSISIDGLTEELKDTRNRVTTHGKEIDAINKNLSNHEVRLTNAEHKLGIETVRYHE